MASAISGLPKADQCLDQPCDPKDDTDIEKDAEHDRENTAYQRDDGEIFGTPFIFRRISGNNNRLVVRLLCGLAIRCLCILIFILIHGFHGKYSFLVLQK